ncbi:MAG TPA: TSUP family transporter, partial [Usitatibacter sp.]|nr:TSUP family transporter [Usitatibacter sp.]
MGEIAAYLAIGGVVGFLAGLLGIGGGIVIVSSLALMFAAHAFPPAFVMHMAIATSLAAMVAGSFASLRTHHRHGAVDWRVVKLMTPGLLAGCSRAPRSRATSRTRSSSTSSSGSRCS